MNKHGQSIIEYALIAILVLLGIFFMGPYVLRSVNAHFKLWDTGVQDSFDETLKQAPVGDMPPVSINCSCNDVTGTNCGGSLGGLQCQSNQVIVQHSCNPPGCDLAPLSFCQINDICCTQYQANGCGQTPIGQVLPTNQSCYVGQQIMATQCPDLPVECVSGAAACNYCNGAVPQAAATACPGPLPTGIVTPTFVANVSACDSTQSTACQYYCNNGYTLTVLPSGAQACEPSACNSSAAPLSASFISTYITTPMSESSDPDAQISVPPPAPPAGSNYYFFNFNAGRNGVLGQTVTNPGIVAPGQTYYLRKQSGRDENDNHCSQTVNGDICGQVSSTFFTGDFDQNDASVVYLTVGDQNPGGEAPYDWQILDSKYNVVFEWNGNIDWAVDVAFTPMSACYTLAVQQYTNCQSCTNICSVPILSSQPEITFGTQFNYGPGCGSTVGSPGLNYSACSVTDPTSLAQSCGNCMQEHLISGQGCADGVASIISITPSNIVAGTCGSSPKAGTEDDIYNVYCNP